MLDDIASVIKLLFNMPMKKLPIGIDSFKKIRQENYCYVDKTLFVKKLADETGFILFTRPRRFGKTLLLDTLSEAFLCNKSLFKDLYLENNWDWKVKHQVLKIDFAAAPFKTVNSLNQYIWTWLKSNFESECDEKHYNISDAFYELIRQKHQRAAQVVILVDNYERPVIDNQADTRLMKDLTDALKNFYSAIYRASRMIKLALFTGRNSVVSKNLLPFANVIHDITLDARYSDICGFTSRELLDAFSQQLDGKNQVFLRKWYGGYSYLGEQLYNPFDVLLYLDFGEFKSYWFETGSPASIVDYLISKKFFLPSLSSLDAVDTQLTSYDIHSVEIPSLLFQAGYLTINKLEFTKGIFCYNLTYPNLEVRSTLNDHLLARLTKNISQQRENLARLYNYLTKAEVGPMKNLFAAFFTSIPYEWYITNHISYKGYYTSIFYAYFAALGLNLEIEDMSDKGRITITIKMPNNIFIFEFKVEGEAIDAKQAFANLFEKEFFKKYLSLEKSIHLIGVDFDPDERVVSEFNTKRF